MHRKNKQYTKSKELKESKFDPDLLIAILRNTIKSIIPKGSSIPTDEIDALARLCIMGTIPTKENPKELVRKISDPIINHIVSKRNESKRNPVIDKISQFFLIEWCYRNNYLKEDWIWQWDGQQNGHISYDSTIPLEEVEFPQNDSKNLTNS